MSLAMPALRAQRGEFLGVDVVANELVLQVALPVDPDGAGDVGQVVEQDVFVALDDADLGILQVVLDPIGRDQDFRMSVRFSHGVDSVVIDRIGDCEVSIGISSELGRDGLAERLADRLDRDPVVDVGEEALDDQSDGRLAWESPRACA